MWCGFLLLGFQARALTRVPMGVLVLRKEDMLDQVDYFIKTKKVGKYHMLAQKIDNKAPILIIIQDLFK